MLPLYQQAGNSSKIMRKKGSRTEPLSVPVHTGNIHAPKIKKKGGEEADFTDSNISSPTKGLISTRSQRFMEIKLR